MPSKPRAHRTKGTTKSKQFLGNSQFVSTDLLDTSYLRRTYYDLTFGAMLQTARLLGGEITLTSTLGSGSRFRIYIPLGSTHLPAERIKAPQGPVSSATAARSVRSSSG